MRAVHGLDRTSIGLKKVIINSIGPASNVKIVRVAVTLTFLTMVGWKFARSPSHSYVIPSIRANPDQPIIVLGFVAKLGHVCEWIEVLVVDSHVLKYVDRTASGTLAGKKVCCAWEKAARETKRMTVEKRDEKGQLDSMNETRI